MKCPFYKTTVYNCGQNTGAGYPLSWKAIEEFEDCIGKECAAFAKVHDLDTNEWIDYCKLCNGGY